MSDPGGPISGEQIRAVRALFDATVALEPEQRPAFLAGADPTLRKEVERLLSAAASGAGSSLDSEPSTNRNYLKSHRFLTELPPHCG